MLTKWFANIFWAADVGLIVEQFSHAQSSGLPPTAAQMFFCELVAAEKLKIENLDPSDFSFIHNAVGKWATEWPKFHPHLLISLITGFVSEF